MAADHILQEQDRYAAILDDLVTLAEDLARQVHAAAGKDLPLNEATVAFDRIARALRRTIALARRLKEPPRGNEPVAARRRVIREVEDAIARNAPPAAVPGLHAELRERLDDPELDDELNARPVEAVIADIRRDLGLVAVPGHPTTWPRRTPADIRALNARAARPTPRARVQPRQAAEISPKPPEPGTSPKDGSTSAGSASPRWEGAG